MAHTTMKRNILQTIALIVLKIPLPGILIALFPYWWNILKAAFIRVQTYITAVQAQAQPTEYCEFLSWNDISDGPLHLCRESKHKADLIEPCQHIQHHSSGYLCWKDTIGAFFNTTLNERKKKYINKPRGLKRNREFLRVDPKIISAYVLSSLAIFEEKSAGDSSRPALRMHFQKDRYSREILVHIESHSNILGPRNSPFLTKNEVECLLRGYPPFYRETIEHNGFYVQWPIRTEADIARGGWIIAIGLQTKQIEPIPLYKDVLREATGECGMVFWRSIFRVQEILETNFVPAYAGRSIVIHAALMAIRHSVGEHTLASIPLESCGELPWEASQPPSLSYSQCILAMEVFNQSPYLSGEQLDQLRLKTEPILPGVLYAAVKGVERCVKYIREPRRELEDLIPPWLDGIEYLYIKGCK
ncbi:hypothetical protein M422DRAFT_777654 [Sphaerobolus stellatus SS14]|nr:hypothetical protein M422DRAFT_777654 [Sphaerobolus stellatus SS14]